MCSVGLAGFGKKYMRSRSAPTGCGGWELERIKCTVLCRYASTGQRHHPIAHDAHTIPGSIAGLFTPQLCAQFLGVIQCLHSEKAWNLKGDPSKSTRIYGWGPCRHYLYTVGH